MTFSFKSFAICTTALLYSAFSHAGFYCELAAGYELPRGVEFADQCIYTDIDNEHILWLVKSEGRYGFVNDHGNIVIPLIFSDANSFYHGMAAVRLDDKWGLIDTSGKLIIPNDYDSISLPHDGLVRASIGGEDSRYGFLNLNNETVIPFDYHYAEDFREGFAVVVKNGKQGVIDKQNNIVIPMAEYDYILNTDSDEPETKDWQFRLGTYDPPRVLILNSQGEQVFPTYQITGFFKNGLINVKKNGKWGFVDGNNQTKIDFVYDEALSFYNHDRALVFQDGKRGFINPKGEVITPIEYDSIGISEMMADAEFISGRKGDTYYLIYKEGTEIKTDYDKIGSFQLGLAPVMKYSASSPTGKYYGVLSDNGMEIIPLIYPSLTIEYGGQYHGLIKVVTNDGHHYILGRDGSILVDQTMAND